MNSKTKAIKMIQHSHYDRKAGKIVRTMVPESGEHKKIVKGISKTISKYKEPNHADYQKTVGRAYSE